MARYYALLGRRIEVHYRAGDILLPATGTLVADSGRSIFLEERFTQRGQIKTFRWEIPYQCITRLNDSPTPPSPPEPALPASAEKTAAQASVLPLRNRPREV